MRDAAAIGAERASLPDARGEDGRMTPEEVYDYLVAGDPADGCECDPFGRHILASILTIAYDEAERNGSPIVDGVGLDRPDLAGMLGAYFPHAAARFLRPGETAPTRGEDEVTLIDLLTNCGTTGSSFEALLAPMVARRAQRPNHLWQDLGLQNRGELSELMMRHFAPLAVRNDRDMKWKKFLYRTICRDTGYSLCTAPSCSECPDFDLCFNEETGESFLARIRRDADRAS